jgi:hypothetical protein
MALTDSLISYWSLDEASGDALDAHGSNDLTDNNTVGTAAGKVAGARDFERGSSQHFSLADNADLSTGDIDFTIAAWVQLESKPGGNMSVVQKTTNLSGEYFFFHEASSDRFKLEVYGAGGFGSVGAVTANNLGAPSLATWYFVVAWHDSANNEVGISVNAGTPDTAAHSAGVLDGAGAFELSGFTFGTFWDGLIDEVGFWKRVLTADERTELYNGGDGLAYPFDGGGGGFVAYPRPRGARAGMLSLAGGMH